MSTPQPTTGPHTCKAPCEWHCSLCTQMPWGPDWQRAPGEQGISLLVFVWAFWVWDSWEVMGHLHLPEKWLFSSWFGKHQCFNNQHSWSGICYLNICPAWTTIEETIMCCHEVIWKGLDISWDLYLGVMNVLRLWSKNNFSNTGRNGDIHHSAAAQQDPSDASIWPIVRRVKSYGYRKENNFCLSVS